ncbi:MAG: isoleucine--tRNA ligase [Fimbriimonadaceae bacterium]|nr:isoleucine--tRNA ligase [Fimbriimonadaceae bacterium]
MDFKPTLNLPDPDFTIPMRASLAQREPERQAIWTEQKLYHRLQEARRDAPPYVLHDGPPYTNGPIHLGTAMNKILKDLVIKSHLLMGHRTPYVPGYDNHGLPIEQAVLKKFQEKKITPDIVTLRQACREHAEHFIQLQSEQFQRLGVFGTWEHPYNSLEFPYEAEIVRVFKRLVERGFVYRGLRPVLWSPTSQTALADTEIVYQDYTSTAIYVAFALREDRDSLFAEFDNVSAVIWTTTPWTIPANLAVAFHPKLTYVIARVGDQHYVLLKDLLEKTAETVGWSNPKIVKEFPGAEAENAVFWHPFADRASRAVLADYVTTEDGTGVVHTAPGHGRDDFFTGQKYGLPVLNPVDAKGRFTEEAGEFAGLHYKKDEQAILDKLTGVGALLHQSEYHHSYPHAERDNMPVIFRATEQWFINLDHDNLRERMVAAIDVPEGDPNHIVFEPEFGRARLRGMIQNRPDWCISRQRPWGVGIPVFYGAQSGKPVLDSELIEKVAEITEQEGSDMWYAKSPSEILPNGYVHPETGETEFTMERDVFDVWFDSGCTCMAVLEGNVDPVWKEDLPVDCYLEGSDQHRGWFNVSLILSMAIKNVAPYRAVVTHGFVVDEKGLKMAKRAGNSIDPLDVCNEHGADVLRWWVASVDYSDDVPFSKTILAAASEHYRTVRNTLRFLLGNLSDFTPDDAVMPEKVDRWIVEEADRVAIEVIKAYQKFDFRAASTAIHHFCVQELSRFYMEAIKDTMYCDATASPRRRGAQTACWRVLRRLVPLVMPILPHTADEVWERMPGSDESVFLATIPPINAIDAGLDDRVKRLLALRDRMNVQLEQWRNASGVKDGSEAAVAATLPASEAESLRYFGPDIAMLFKVAEFEISDGTEAFSFTKSELPRCERCRMRRPDAQELNLEGDPVVICGRCRAVVGA